MGLKKHDPCCSQMKLVKNRGSKVCRSCGQVRHYIPVSGYTDLYENKYKIKRKSIYQRKYHIHNLLHKICEKHFIDLHNKNKIMRIFKEIQEKLQDQLNKNRKRMISIQFILKKLFTILGLPHKGIQTTKSQKNDKRI